MGKVKGSALKSSVAYLEGRLGPQGFERLLSKMSPAEADALRVPVLQSAWYDIGILFSLMTLAEGQIRPSGSRSVVWEMGRFSAEFGLRTIYKIFLKVADPQFIISKASQVFSNYYDTGDMQVVRKEDGATLLRLLGFEPSHPLFCERFMGWMERTLELSGATPQSITHPKCRTRGDTFCEFDARWK